MNGSLIENGWLTRFQKHIELEYCSIMFFFSSLRCICTFCRSRTFIPIVWVSVFRFDWAFSCSAFIKQIITVQCGDATCVMLIYYVIISVLFFLCGFFFSWKGSPLAQMNPVQWKLMDSESVDKWYFRSFLSFMTDWFRCKSFALIDFPHCIVNISFQNFSKPLFHI